MAEVLFAELASRLDPEVEWRVESAGEFAEPGQPAAENSQAIAAERGLDLTGHRSQSTTAELLAGFDLILVMEDRHKQWLDQAHPELADRIWLLSQMAFERRDVWDPIGRELKLYRAMADEVASYLERGWERIRELVGAEGEQ